jgi:hypothetical protein
VYQDETWESQREAGRFYPAEELVLYDCYRYEKSGRTTGCFLFSVVVRFSIGVTKMKIVGLNEDGSLIYEIVNAMDGERVGDQYSDGETPETFGIDNMTDEELIACNLARE